ncbi:wd repeat-containing protein 52 [Limosa lapponica baueri]|uniref:Wd repeat-containing protein 52 n=1 Tax=Limosa lapponica baueri TaxID=1758121 RepID=A0A2I0TRI2_LIMLA|nr:wd repeat-containing protein 52 [Limosa lapponica baueri]
MQNGALRVYPLEDKDLTVNTLKEYWSFNVHDNDYGQIQGICSSHDDRFLITCGGDGNIFSFNILSPEDVHKELKAKIPSPRQYEMDHRIFEELERQTAQRIQLVRKELAWEHEKHLIGLQKLRNQYESKPSDDYENPKDAEDIREAQENMGCYELKTATNYRVPEHKRMNTAKKVMQLTSLEVLIHKKKVNMNKEIMSLRDLKVSIIDEIKCLVQELKSIQAVLDLSERLPLPLIPQLHPDEVPEKKFEYDSDTLLKFKEEQEAKAKLQEKLEGSSSSDALRHGFLQAPSIKEIDPVAQVAGAQAMEISSVVTEQRKVLGIEKAEPTEMELEILKREKIKNLYLQETLVKKINALVINFDAELRFLRHKKLKLDVQMKSADLRYVTWYEELLILKNLEKHENLLQEHINNLISEQEDMQSKLNSYLAQMEDRKCEIVKLQECEKALYANFQASLGEGNEFAHFLTKVLKKKIECTEKKEVEREAGEEDENEEENDEESSLGVDEQNSGSEDEVFDDTVCPNNCSEALFQNTIQLRQKRLDIEKALTEEKKVAADLKKKYNALVKKAKVVEISLNTTEKELETFQWEKQQRLNELYVVVPLKLHQVEYLVNGEMPSDFSQALVFTNQTLEYLQRRIVDLRNEKIMQREIYKVAQEQHKQLVQDKKEMEIEIRHKQLQMACM